MVDVLPRTDGRRGRVAVLAQGLQSMPAALARFEQVTAKLTRIPAPSEVPYPVHMEPNLVIEFYSR